MFWSQIGMVLTQILSKWVTFVPSMRVCGGPWYSYSSVQIGRWRCVGSSISVLPGRAFEPVLSFLEPPVPSCNLYCFRLLQPGLHSVHSATAGRSVSCRHLGPSPPQGPSSSEGAP